MREKKEVEMLLKALCKKQAVPILEINNNFTSIILMDNGLTVYKQNKEQICSFYSKAETIDGKQINTKSAVQLSWEIQEKEDCLGKNKSVTVLYENGELLLKQVISIYEQSMMTVKIFLHDKLEETRTRFLAPFTSAYPQIEDQPLFRSLDQKMLYVPYDNDMWSRYESSVPCCGRKSYDVTAIYDENVMEGLIIGALDFDVWKNAIEWSPHDARCVSAFCGVADGGTHDICPHTPVCGDWVESSRFCVFWSKDIRRGLEQYGDICVKNRAPRSWPDRKVPFGWNSYSGLALDLKLSHWQEAGKFIKEQLPEFCGEDGTAYINLDGAFGLDEEEIKKTIENMHKNGQKAGWYANPCNWFADGGELCAEGTDIKMKDLFLRDYTGNVMPAADGTVPLDVTHPKWEVMARTTIKRLIGLGVDYIKLDFLTHGSVEGAHFRKNYTGRMALNLAYQILEDEINRSERSIFVSLSIAPLFPYFLGNSRRCCCDTFGHYDDVRYVLNALNFAWWTNGRIYQFNDPDHMPLYISAVDKREATTEAEARSRYYASVISGTVMMLSDNYGPEGDKKIIENSRQRAREIANHKEINEIARWGRAFIPVELKDKTVPFYTLCYKDRKLAAIFNFDDKKTILSFEAIKGGLPEKGRFSNVCGGKETAYEDFIEVTLDAYDAIIIEIFE